MLTKVKSDAFRGQSGTRQCHASFPELLKRVLEVLQTLILGDDGP